MSLSPTILIVEDEKNARDGLRHFLESLDYDVLVAANGREALPLVKKENPDIVLSDLKMPEIDGMELLHEIKRTKPEPVERSS